MDKMSQDIIDFESLLKNRSTSRPIALYGSSKNSIKHGNPFKTSNISVKEVLSDVSRQIKAIQNADSVAGKRGSCPLDKYKKGEFLPVYKILDNKEVPQKLPTKFETQCVTDTQLINVVENAEIIDKNRGVTQEFDKTFCQKSVNDSEGKFDDDSSQSNTHIDTENTRVKVNTDVIIEHNSLNTQDSKMFENSDLITCDMDTVTCCQNNYQTDLDEENNLNTSQETEGFNKCVEIFDVSDVERSTSPVLNTVKRGPTPTFVVDLYTFEKFEDLAVPIIEEHEDLKVAKSMINSQIIGREISILEHFNEVVGRDSPVLGKIECITTNINKDELERICTCSNKCVDVQPMNEAIKHSLNSGDKKTNSKIKTDIKDEILFSSDEENEYLHKNVQELPLTCALETSFYDCADVLDTTMYVGFQTASNKSIQINTDSFTKAKNILSDIDNEVSGKSLSDLVNMFDSHNAVSINEECVNDNHNEIENDTTSQTCDKVDNENKNSTAPSTSFIDFKKTVGNTFNNVSLTALEKGKEIKDDIVMSQIIQFKSTSRSAKIMASILSDRKLSNTESLTSIKPKNDADEDIIMSQVIQFKSMSRTPNVDNVCAASVSQVSSLPNKSVTKRKFEGFKTASNKKIKLSDKALARCKKVFQDIDLGDPNDMGAKLNTVAAEEDFLDDFKSDDFKVSDDGLKINSEIDPTRTKKHENVSDIDKLKTTSEKNCCDPEACLRVKTEAPKSEDVDLHINDHVILQEFEDNEMPFEVTNNNAYVGFTTASNKDIIISAEAKAATKNLFQDITPVALANDSDINNSRDIKEHVFKKPAIDFKKLSNKQTQHETYNVPHEKKYDSDWDTVQKCQINDFVGFKTASNKEIVISEQAKEKTKGFYKDVDDEVIKNVDNKVKCNTNNEKQSTNFVEDFNCGIDTQDFLGEELTHIEDLFKDNILENQKPISPIFQGFQMANHKPVVISEKALEKSKMLLKDITNEDNDMKLIIENKIIFDKKEINKRIDTCIDNVNNIENSKALLVLQNKKNIDNKTPESDRLPTQLSDTALDNRTKITYDQRDLRAKHPILVGFQTASAKPIRISAHAMEKTKKLLSEFELNDGDIIFGDVYEETPDSRPSTFVGFQTASNKEVTISAKSLAESSQVFNDFKLRNNFHEGDAEDKNIPYSSFDDDTKANNILQVTDSTDIPHHVANSKFIGFKTASNKEVNVSKEALARSKKMFQDINQCDKESDVFVERDFRREEKTSIPFKGVQTAGKKAVTTSKTALEKSKIFLNNIYVTTNTNEPIPMFKGFQTASNKKVQISETALAKSKRLFEDMNLSQLNNAETIVDTHENTDFDTETDNSKIIKVFNLELPQTNNMIRDIHLEKENITRMEESIPVFKGFQTASNKKVQISEIALAKSKKKIDDINLSQLYNNSKTTVCKDNFKGLQEVNTVSDQAFQTEDIVEEINDTNKPDKHENAPMFTGFQTASNKKVEISEKALIKSKKLFEDINLSQLGSDSKTTTQEVHFGGFQTANNKTVTVSAQALAKTTGIFEEVISETMTDMPENHNCTVFKGFQTASNKKVIVSEKALAKCKQLFEDINLSQVDKEYKTTVDANDLKRAKANDLIHNINEPVSVNKDDVGSFQTASSKRFKIFEHALMKSKVISKDKHAHNVDNLQYKDKEIKTSGNKENSTENTNIINNDIIDTQILNDFQETLNTEDFCKSTPTSKRSGSPILSCPKAKKRKFETPYRKSKKIEPRNPFVPPKLAKTYNFDDNYKKEKKYILRDISKLEKECTKVNIDPYIAQYNLDNLLNFIFKDKRNDYTAEEISIEDLKKVFLGSVNKKIVPDGWLENHIKLIIWKLLSYEVKFPNVLYNTCTVKNVLEQLKYRYDRELYHVQRPILRKILEKDEGPSKTMVLCVAGIYVDNINVVSVNPSSQNVELLLTDGWYCVKASLDRMLVKLVTNGAIVVGTKIAVCGAELVNCEQGVAPWEDTSSVRLKLHGNSVRRARWHCRLGARTDLIQCPLAVAKADGGKMAATRVVVTRVYPPLYVEKMNDGSTVTLSDRLEQIRQMKYESERQAVMEKLYEEVEKEMSDQDSQDSEGSCDKGCMDSGSQISRNMRNSKDPDEFRSHLTKSQHGLLEDHNARQREKLIERVRGKFQQKLESNGLKDRNVVPLLKLRVAGFTEKGNIDITKGYLSIWKPSAAILELVTEGAWIEILNVIPTGIRNSEIQLSAGRQTIFNPYKHTNEKLALYTNSLLRKCYEIKEITQNPAMTTDNNEIDTVGMIFSIEPSNKDFKEQNFQNVYLADADKNIICVNFWGGLKKFGFENVLDTGQIITCVNLQKRAGNTRKSIPQYRVTEFSYFTKTPKAKKALEITNELASKLSKIKNKFCEDCLVLKNNYSIFKTREENVSPYRFEYNVSKKVVSPLRTSETNLNLTGFDFESSFNSQEISPQLLLRKKKVNEKIEKIRLNYGEPPPLSSIHIVNKSKNASATYKSPLLSNLERSKLESPGLCNVASPVTVNRTFAKNMNPVKLNFTSDNLNESVDHFAEDFDASPPLSLDSDIIQ